MAILTQFLLRLSFGLALGMALTSPRQVTSGYYRNHLYVLLGLNVLATMVALAARPPFDHALQRFEGMDAEDLQLAARSDQRQAEVGIAQVPAIAAANQRCDVIRDVAGDVHAEPAHPDDCVWCDFRTVCRIETRTGDEDEFVQIGAAGAD